MQDQDTEKIRQLLEAALSALEASSDADKTSESKVVSTRAGGALRADAPGQQAVQSCGSSHPGLQRFLSLETESSSPAPRPCFMEPERECVHSGACEMRGF